MVLSKMHHESNISIDISNIELSKVDVVLTVRNEADEEQIVPLFQGIGIL